MDLYAWAAKWGVSAAALRELADVPLGTQPAESGTSESAVQSLVRLEAAAKGIHLWRNNVGAGMLENGLFIRWGIANDSPAVNEVIKSADLIGVRQRFITSKDVGTIIGQFVSREIKCANWRYTGTPREKAQLRWKTLIESNGGDAAFATGVGTL